MTKCKWVWERDWREESRQSSVLWGDAASKVAPRGGLPARPSSGKSCGFKLKTDVFGVHSLSYYCSIVIYKSVWDMEISHATSDMDWVKAHCATCPYALWEGLICKRMLSLHLARAVYSMFSSSSVSSSLVGNSIFFGKWEKHADNTSWS